MDNCTTYIHNYPSRHQLHLLQKLEFSVFISHSTVSQSYRIWGKHIFLTPDYRLFNPSPAMHKYTVETAKTTTCI